MTGLVLVTLVGGHVDHRRDARDAPPDELSESGRGLVLARATLDEDGWLHTGDAVRMDEDRDVWIVDRLQAGFMVGGRIVYPGDVERVLLDHPTVADAAVAGLVERGLIEEAGRADTPGAAVLYRTTPVFSRVFALEDGLASLPSLDELTPAEAGADALRGRLQAVASDRE
jgi:hypothetical protein